MSAQLFVVSLRGDDTEDGGLADAAAGAAGTIKG